MFSFVQNNPAETFRLFVVKEKKTEPMKLLRLMEFCSGRVLNINIIFKISFAVVSQQRWDQHIYLIT